ncbi:MAG: IS3 family transposase [Sterolibacteriaceae bacterium]|nr:IS3 family transposase [Candidatus Methylophosphatis haderslevensis]
MRPLRRIQKWLADLTYVPTDEGWLYLALVLDMFGRKIVGWATSDTMPQELTAAALWVALGWRDPQPGLMHHSDRGSQYAARHYRKVLEARGITVSMSRKGDCWDNAPMESAKGTLKVECVHGGAFPDPRRGPAGDRRVHRLLQYAAQTLVVGKRLTG